MQIDHTTARTDLQPLAIAGPSSNVMLNNSTLAQCRNSNNRLGQLVAGSEYTTTADKLQLLAEDQGLGQFIILRLKPLGSTPTS